MKDNKGILLKYMAENPDLPIVFMACSDEICDEYSYTFFENYHVYESTIYKTDERIYDDFYDVFDYYRDYFCDDEMFKDIKNDDEYDKAIEKWITENIEHYEAIVVTLDS